MLGSAFGLLQPDRTPDTVGFDPLQTTRTSACAVQHPHAIGASRASGQCDGVGLFHYNTIAAAA